MDDSTFTFDVCIESARELLFKLGPPHMWRLLTGVEQVLNHFVRFADIDGVDPNSFIMFYESLKSTSAIVRSSQSLDFGFSSIVT